MNRKDFNYIFKIIREVLKYIIKIIKYILSIIPSLIGKLFNELSKRLKFSITFKLTTIYILVFTFFIYILSGGVLLAFGGFLIYDSQKNLEKSSEIITKNIIGNNEYMSAIEAITKKDNTNCTIFNEEKNVVYTTEKEKSTIIFQENANIFKNNDTFTNLMKNEQLVLSSKINTKPNNQYIQISKSLAKEKLYMKRLFIILLILDNLAIIIAIRIGSKSSKKMLLPIKKMIKTVKAISVQDLNTRIDVGSSHDELKELAETFNDMIDRIQNSYEQQEQFVSDASHELRTPISVIQGYANLLYRWGKDDKEVLEESINAIKSEAENMKDLTEKLLFLARSDKNTQKIEKEDFLLNELLDEIVKETKLIDTKHKIDIYNSEPIYINADRKLIKQALRIFIDNSIKFTPENGVIKVMSKLSKKHIIIEVEDTGAGIPKEDIPHIFNRFYRVEKSRTKEKGGNGLGLSIAKWIIVNHNGFIDVVSEINVGTKIIIFFPR